MPAVEPNWKLIDELEAEIRSAVGMLAIEFGRCELAVSELAASALGAAGADVRDVIDAVLSFRQKLDVISAMGRKVLSSKQDLKLLCSSLSRLQHFEEQRNTLLHSKFNIVLPPPDDDGPHGFARSKRRANRKAGLVRTWENVNVESIVTLADELRRFCAHFGEHTPVYDLYAEFQAAHAK
jgi:hypothetical protein